MSISDNNRARKANNSKPKKLAMLEHALGYARMGWPVSRRPSDGKTCRCREGADCRNKGKHPIAQLAPRGFKNATTNSKKIKQWWGRYPRAGIGMPTGEASELVVIDTDHKNGKDGRITLAKLERELGPLPDTRTSQTPNGGGKHGYFKNPGGIINSDSKLGPGLDTRGEGGFVVLPPSHDGLYRWIGNSPIAELPKPWIGHLRDMRGKQQRPSQGEQKIKPETKPKTDIEKVVDALRILPNGIDVTRSEWVRVGVAMHAATGGDEARVQGVQ